jgi:filamentous hemagglutinin
VNDLRNDPALAGKVDWQAVDAEFREWDYKSQGLTEAGAALVTLVATALTAGTGVTAAMSASLTTSLGGGAAMNAALNAGLQTLINKTAVSLVNNQGDLGATLKELGSTDTLRSLATAMVTAGLTTQLLQSAGLGIDLPATAPFPDRLVQNIQQGLIKATVRAGVTTAIEGGKLDDALVAALRLEAASILGEHVAQTIGAAYRSGDVDSVGQLIAHAALGCATGALASGDCGAGAAGAFAGELAAKLQIRNWTENKLEQYASLQGKPLSAAEAKALQASLQAEFLSFKQQGVDIARLAGGLAAALTGGDVYTGADAGGNAAANNSWTAAGAAAGCAVGAPAAGVGCPVAAAAGAAAGAAVDVAVIILGVAGLVILNQTAEDANSDSSAENDPNDGAGDRVTNPTKGESPIWKGLDNAGNGRKKSGSGSKTRYYEWDHTHNDIEVYDNKGRHLGSADPSTGELYKPRVPGRKIQL